jgi:hypothetical protein
MASKVAICNMALSHLGNAVEITDLDTEASAEASACRRFFDDTVDAVLRDFDWGFARHYQALGLVTEDPNDEWAYEYQLPSDCVRLRKILSGVRNETRQSRIPYELSFGVAGTTVFTDQADAVAKYTRRVTDTERFPVDFVLALSFRLAHYIAPRVTGGDPFQLGKRALELYQVEIAKAQAAASHEEQPEEEPDSQFGRFRGSDDWRGW